MPTVEQLEGALWGVGLGILTIAALWLVLSNGWFRTGGGAPAGAGEQKREPMGAVDEYPEGIAEAHGPTTLFLKLTIVAFVLWAVAYVIVFLVT